MGYFDQIRKSLKNKVGADDRQTHSYDGKPSVRTQQDQHYSLNDKGSQSKTPGQSVPTNHTGKLDNKAMRDAVPGTEDRQDSHSVQDDQRDHDSGDDDVDVVIKLSALRKLKQSASSGTGGSR